MDVKTKHSWKSNEPNIKELAKEDTLYRRLSNFGNGNEVYIRSNPKMRQDRVFELTIGKEKAIIDVDQLAWWTRLF